MGKYFDMLQEDVRVKEGLAACMNCGICTGVCPAASYYDYDPRQIVSIVQTQDDAAIEKLMRSDTIWSCDRCRNGWAFLSTRRKDVSSWRSSGRLVGILCVRDTV